LRSVENHYQADTSSHKDGVGQSWKEVLTRDIILLKLKSRSCKSGFSIWARLAHCKAMSGPLSNRISGIFIYIF